MDSTGADSTLQERVARLEARLDEVERNLELRTARASASEAPSAAPEGVAAAQREVRVAEGDFELDVGQNWFARLGIVVLALGVVYTLEQPYPQVAAWAPSSVGFAAAALLFVISSLLPKPYELLANYSRGSAMLLLFFSVQRLSHFGATRALSADSSASIALAAAVLAVNYTLSRRRGSANLMTLTLLTGYASLLASRSTGFVLLGLPVLAALAVEFQVRGGRRLPLMVAMPATYATYLAWAASPSLHSHAGLAFVEATPACLLVPLACTGLFASASLLRPDRSREDLLAIYSCLMNAGAGYLTFLLHTLGILAASFAAVHVSAAVVYISVATAFWLRGENRASTFVYSMTGYVALSVALLKAFPSPTVFVWLALESLLVVATAIWYRSRFIVLTNFVIYLAMVGAYMVLSTSESGISLWFGVVALLSARILNWQQSRLELRTELMRNAYLLSAFIIFPYALYHLVPARFVSPAWIGLALFYYAMNFIINNRKYRWMGHCTLLLTAVYFVAQGSRELDPLYRNLSFLALGLLFLAVSLVFTRNRAKRAKAGS